jgi:hypothetical protein
MMVEVESEAVIKEILAGHSPEVVELVHALRELVKQSAPDLAEEPKRGWGNISYKKKGLVCAISPEKSYASLYFYKGTQLADPYGQLEGSGKELRHIKVRKLDDITVERIAVWIKEAVGLDAGSTQA